MPLFFFHFRSATSYEWDDLGLDFPDVENAYLTAYRAIANIVPCLKERGYDPLRCAFEITDDQGLQVMSVPFTEALRRAS